MTFTIDSTADLDVLRARARDIARTYLKPLTSSERPAALNRPLIQALGDLGLLPMLFSVSNGGSAQPDSPYAAILCALREGLAMECPEASMALTLQAGASSALVQSSADEAKAHWLPLIARGEAVPAFALSEPEFGSDAGNIELSAARVDSGWALSGKKTWISNAPEADVYTIVARTTPDAGSRGVTNFLVPGDAAGLTGEALDLVKSYPTGSLRLDRVLVTEHQVLGQVDGGFKLVSATLHAARLAVAAAAIGCAQAALDDAISYAGTRHVFGQKLGNFQAISHRIAESAASLAAARLLVYDGARAFDRGAQDVAYRAAMGKFFGTEAAHKVVDVAIQVHGARGLSTDNRLTQFANEVRAALLEDGTTEITKDITARHLLRS